MADMTTFTVHFGGTALRIRHPAQMALTIDVAVGGQALGILCNGQEVAVVMVLPPELFPLRFPHRLITHPNSGGWPIVDCRDPKAPKRLADRDTHLLADVNGLKVIAPAKNLIFPVFCLYYANGLELTEGHEVHIIDYSTF